MDTGYRVHETQRVKELRERLANVRDKIMTASSEPGFATSLYGQYLICEYNALTLQLHNELRVRS